MSLMRFARTSGRRMTMPPRLCSSIANVQDAAASAAQHDVKSVARASNYATPCAIYTSTLVENGAALPLQLVYVEHFELLMPEIPEFPCGRCAMA